MLALMCYVIKHRADAEKREMRLTSKIACIASVVFSYIFVYAMATQKPMDHRRLAPGRGGMSRLRPLGAGGRYISMLALIVEVLR